VRCSHVKESNFRCQFCGYVPHSHEQPGTGVWYCPKCGKRTTIRLTVPSPRRSSYKKPQSRQASRDQISSQIYRELTKEKSQEYGLKEPYLNPTIQPIKPKLRKKVRIFAPSKDND
jgi:ribosomal protein L37AE/L43A